MNHMGFHDFHPVPHYPFPLWFGGGGEHRGVSIPHDGNPCKDVGKQLISCFTQSTGTCKHEYNMFEWCMIYQQLRK